ncbi:MAG: hypothetical protein IJO53_12625, partial [Clostridia bacterium]|nr:hypothetical protein [Clostridia bacterium]
MLIGTSPFLSESAQKEKRAENTKNPKRYASDSDHQQSLAGRKKTARLCIFWLETKRKIKGDVEY